MPNTNGHGSKRAILYARVSTDEQARSGYSLAQQIEALRAYAARQGYEVLEEVQDPGQSGASLERPGMDRVRDLVAGGGVSVVLAQGRDRFARDPAYHYLLRREFEEHGTKIRALNDRGDESPEGELTDGILDQLAKYERAKLGERTRRGKLRKAREGKLLRNSRAHYGFEHDATGEAYLVVEEEMRVVGRIIRGVAEGRSLNSIRRMLEIEGVPAPEGGRYWSPSFLRTVVLEDVYRPHPFIEIEGLVAPEVAAKLDESKSYGIFWSNRTCRLRTRVSESGPNGREYRWQHSVRKNPREQWIAIPVPDCRVSWWTLRERWFGTTDGGPVRGGASSNSAACSVAGPAARRCSTTRAYRRGVFIPTVSVAESSATATTLAQPASLARGIGPRSWSRRSGSRLAALCKSPSGYEKIWRG